MDSSGTMQIVQINTFTDGLTSKWPQKEGWEPDPAVTYLSKLASMWMRQRGDAVNGIEYRLDKLPKGYRLFKRSRPGNNQHTDKFLYGHPSGRHFHSPNHFRDHFIFLMQHSPHSRPCSCDVCVPSKVTRPSFTTMGRERIHHQATEVRKIRPAHIASVVPDPVIKLLAIRLQHEDAIDEEIQERVCWDWRLIEKLVIPEACKILSMPSFFPRLGEVVLYNSSVDEKPHWEAGVVSQTSEEFPSKDDPFLEHPKSLLLSEYGFKVDPIKCKNSDPSYSSYHPLLKLRPFALFRELIPIREDTGYSASVEKTLEYMASFALLMKYHVKGSWPDITFFSKAIWLGAELLLVGDTVKVLPTKMPTDSSEPKEVYLLEIESIRLEIHNLDDPKTLSTHIFFLGKAFTQQSHSLLHSQTQQYQIPVARILGRHYSLLAHSKWFPSGPFPANVGAKGISQARRFSIKNDERISRHDGRQWHWAESRAEQLKLDRFNGLLVGDKARARLDDDEDKDDPAILQRLLKSIDKFDSIASKKAPSKPEAPIDLDEDEDDDEDGQPNHDERHNILKQPLVIYSDSENEETDQQPSEDERAWAIHEADLQASADLHDQYVTPEPDTPERDSNARHIELSDDESEWASDAGDAAQLMHVEPAMDYDDYSDEEPIHTENTHHGRLCSVVIPANIPNRAKELENRTGVPDGREIMVIDSN